MRLHLQEGLDLADGQVLSVAEGDQFVKGAKQFVCISENFSLVEALAGTGDDLSEQVQGVNVLQDVGLLVGDEDHVEFVQWLVYESDIILLDSRMLGSAIRELGEGRKERLYSGSWHFSELSREDSFPSTGANRRS